MQLCLKLHLILVTEYDGSKSFHKTFGINFSFPTPNPGTRTHVQNLTRMLVPTVKSHTLFKDFWYKFIPFLRKNKDLHIRNRTLFAEKQRLSCQKLYPFCGKTKTFMSEVEPFFFLHWNKMHPISRKLKNDRYILLLVNVLWDSF